MENEKVLAESQTKNSFTEKTAFSLILIGIIGIMVGTFIFISPLIRILFGVFLPIGVLFLVLARCSSSIIVTDRRVSGKTGWGKQVDLPLRQISAVSKQSNNTLGVSTASGLIKFSRLENAEAVYQVLTGLINEMQTQASIASSAAPAPAPVIQQSTDADELAKFKALLDSGAITQEEYDAKKKQILGL